MLRSVVVSIQILDVTTAFCQADAALIDRTALYGAVSLQLPRDMPAQSASLSSTTRPAISTVRIEPQEVRFHGLSSSQRHELTVVLKSGLTLQGVDLGWYAKLPPQAKKPEPISDDDTRQIRSLVTEVKDFYNHKSLLALSGDQDRATALVRLVRDTDFYAGKGQIIWRIELWYFENQAGGWAPITQQNKVIRRERFKDADAYKTATTTVKFVQNLGGIAVEPGKTTSISLTKEEIDASPTGYAPKEHEKRD